MEVEEREVYLDEVKDFAECGLCGTAAVISPVGKIVMTMAKRFVSQAEWSRWDQRQRNFMIHLQVSRWVE